MSLKKHKWIWMAGILAVIIIVIAIKPAPQKDPNCALFTLTQSDLKYIAITFYPKHYKFDFKLSQEQITKLKDKGLANLRDRWGHQFKIIDSATGNSKPLIYSIGKNGVDDNGTGDDVVVNNFENKNLYCK